MPNSDAITSTDLETFLARTGGNDRTPHRVVASMQTQKPELPARDLLRVLCNTGLALYRESADDALLVAYKKHIGIDLKAYEQNKNSVLDQYYPLN